MKKRIGIILLALMLSTSVFSVLINAQSINENFIINDFKFKIVDIYLELSEDTIEDDCKIWHHDVMTPSIIKP